MARRYQAVLDQQKGAEEMTTYEGPIEVGMRFHWAPGFVSPVNVTVTAEPYDFNGETCVKLTADPSTTPRRRILPGNGSGPDAFRDTEARFRASATPL